MFSTANADNFKEKFKGQIAALSYVPFVSHASLKLHKNQIIQIGSKNQRCVTSPAAIIRFSILLEFLETVLSYFLNLFSYRLVRYTTALPKRVYMVFMPSRAPD